MKVSQQVLVPRVLEAGLQVHLFGAGIAAVAEKSLEIIGHLREGVTQKREENAAGIADGRCVPAINVCEGPAVSAAAADERDRIVPADLQVTQGHEAKRIGPVAADQVSTEIGQFMAELVAKNLAGEKVAIAYLHHAVEILQSSHA